MQHLATETARWAVLAMCLSLGFSRGIFATSMAVALIAWSLSGRWRALIDRSDAWLWASLVIWMYASVLWSEGIPKTIAYGAGIHWKLLLIPIIASLIDTPEWWKRCWLAFSVGMCVVLVHIYALLFTQIPWVSSQSPTGVFFNPLPQSIALSVFTLWCLDRLISHSQTQWKKVALIVALLLAAYAVLQISQQRLGYLALFAGGVIVVAMRLPSRQRILGLLALLAIAAAVISLSPKIKEGLVQATEEIQRYDFKSDYSSLGARLHMWNISKQAVSEAPLFGHGLGSYPVISEKAFNDATMCSLGCLHPHSIYFFYAVEFGLVGLAIFCACIFMMFLGGWNASTTMPMAALVIFCLIGLADTTLWYRGYLYLFVTLLGLVAARPTLQVPKAPTI